MTEKKIRQMLKSTDGEPPQAQRISDTLILSVLQDLDSEKTFPELRDHMTDTAVTENHVFLLIKSIARNYIKIRMHHLAKEFNNNTVKNGRVRKRMRKLILFKNQ